MGVRSSATATVCALGLLAGGCGDGDGVVRTPAVEAPQADVVEFTSGGAELSGFAFGEADTAVVLAHGQGGAKEDWIDVAVALAQRGVTAFTFDFRGYAGQEGTPDTKLVDDLAAAVEAIRDRGASKVHVVGASMGAAAALELAAAEDLAGVISVSSPATFDEVDATAAAGDIDEPSLFVVAEDDQPFAKDAQSLADAAGGRVVTYDGAGHGTDLLDNHADELTTLIVDFVTAPAQPPAP